MFKPQSTPSIVLTVLLFGLLSSTANAQTTDSLTINANNNSNLCLKVENNRLTNASTLNRATGATLRVENTLSINTPAITAPAGSTSVTRGTCGLP